MQIDHGNKKAKYGNKWYSIQNDRGHQHIVVTENGSRRKITVAIPKTDDLLTVEGWERLYQKNIKNNFF